MTRSEEMSAPAMHPRFNGMGINRNRNGCWLVIDGIEYDEEHVRAALAEYARAVEAGEIL